MVAMRRRTASVAWSVLSNDLLNCTFARSLSNIHTLIAARLSNKPSDRVRPIQLILPFEQVGRDLRARREQVV